MKKRTVFDRGIIGGAAALLLASGVAQPAHAHFILRKPDSYVDQQEGAFGGAPQKGGPCGPGGIDDVQPVPTNGKVTELHAGDPLKVEWEITVPHDGYFRIALAEDTADFEDPTFTDATACTYDDSSVMKGAHGNVLMDGIDPGALSQDLVVPDMPCEKCTLQVIQVMRDHGPPNCIYYHCAEVKILPKNGSTTDGGVSGDGGSGGMSMGSGGTSGGSGGVAAPSGSGGMAGVAGASAGTGDKGATAGSGGSPATTGGGGAAAAGSGGAGVTMVPTSSSAEDDDGGCAVAAPGARATETAALSWLGAAVLALAWRRRRR
jgi:MYXO-CTERM domain-containing protein